MSDSSEITIEKQNLNHSFVDNWIDGIEELSKTMEFSKVRTITLKEIQLDNKVAYDIFHDFPNITRLNILNSHFGSKELNNVLTYINPYSLSILDLSGSTFDHFNINDFRRIGGLFGLMELILPSNMNESDKTSLNQFFRPLR